MRTARLSERAAADLAEIYRHTARWFGRDQAEAYYSDFWSCVDLLASQPGIGRLRLDIEPPIRAFHHQRHMIYFDADHQGILIVRILHDRMDLDRHLRGE